MMNTVSTCAKLALAVTALVFSDQPVFAQQASPTESMQRLSLHHVTLFVKDHETVARWYVGMLGFEERTRFVLTRPDGAKIDVIRLVLGDLSLNVSRLDGLTDRNPQMEYAGWRHLSFTVQDVERQSALLRAKGANVVGSVVTFDPPGYRVAFARDPEGNFIEFYQEGVVR